MKINANYDPDTKTITDENGREWPEHFELSEEERKRVDEAVENLRAVCLELCAPCLALVETAYREKTRDSILMTHAPGMRQSDAFAVVARFAALVSEDNKSVADLMLIALVAKHLVKRESNQSSK